MIKVFILTVGKNKESWLSSALSLYEDRLKGKISFKFIILKDEKKLSEQIKELSPIILDLSGKSFSSEEFSSFCVANIKKNGAKIYFAIGGAKGFLGADLSACKKISLSSLTLTHQMVRLLLVEQVYRAYTLWQGLPYHK